MSPGGPEPWLRFRVQRGGGLVVALKPAGGANHTVLSQAVPGFRQSSEQGTVGAAARSVVLTRVDSETVADPVDHPIAVNLRRQAFPSLAHHRAESRGIEPATGHCLRHRDDVHRCAAALQVRRRIRENLMPPPVRRLRDATQNNADSSQTDTNR